ncbi:hypothetical protein [Marinoscillum sp.]|uniref:hypothetical protein n=1 Tax=Marinoscillum sp. TaxID=2024838 RepID=UPI003BABE5A7
MITLDVVDSNGDQVTLDSGKTYSDGQLLFSESYRSEAPVFKYPNVVITDSEIDQIAFDGTTLVFKSWVEGNPIPDQQFVIGKDCCHIEKLEGPDSITLE